MKRSLLVSAFCLLVVSCDSPESHPVAPSRAPHLLDAPPGLSLQTGPPMEATMQMGRPGVGTDFFPPGSHDGSFHAQDAFQPGTVVISAGGTVTFNIAQFHKLAIYDDGIGPQDIDTSLLEDPGLPFEFPPVINDPTGRLARYALAFPAPLQVQYTFNEPGRYLVICEVSPHFVEGRMYAWVIVQ